MKILIELSDNMKEFYVKEAIHSGFMRENPRVKWSEKEKKEAIRYYIIYLVNHTNLTIEIKNDND